MKPNRPAPGVDTGLLDGLIGHQLRRTTHAISADFMAAFEGMRLRAIGDVLGTTEEAAKNCLFRATQKMRAALGDFV